MKLITLQIIFVFASILNTTNGQALDPAQGGENEATAFQLSGPLPLSSSGTTTGYFDDYDEICPYFGSGAPDVVYSYSVTGGNVMVDIDLCGSDYDTKLSVYETTITVGLPYGCNDDFYYDAGCGFYVSKIEGLELYSGFTYFIVIDGYDGLSGNYNLSITAAGLPGCDWGVDIICDPWAMEEDEVCGTNTNGGCDMLPGSQSWESVPSAGATFCGTFWGENGSKDSDWYELTLTETAQVTLTANADHAIQFGLAESTIPGAPTCATLTGTLFPSANAGPCLEGYAFPGELAPGTYWFKVLPVSNTGIPCIGNYTITFTVTATGCPAPDLLTAGNFTTTSADIAWIETGSATAWEFEIGPQFFIPAGLGTIVNSDNITVGGLSENTTYDFYVRAVCESSESAWAGPLNFTTLCSGTISYPWTESFETTWPPSCWTDLGAGSYGWDQSIRGFERTGSQWAFCNKAGAALESPEFTVPHDAWLVFFCKAENQSFPQGLTVKINGTTVQQLTGITSETYFQVNVPLTAYIGQSIKVTFIGETGSGGLSAGICIDDVSVRDAFKWNGNLSTSWQNAGNWNLSDIPGPNDIVTIPTAPSGNRFPEITNIVQASCFQIILEQGASIVVKNGGTLSVLNP